MSIIDKYRDLLTFVFELTDVSGYNNFKINTKFISDYKIVLSRDIRALIFKMKADQIYKNIVYNNRPNIIEFNFGTMVNDKITKIYNSIREVYTSDIITLDLSDLENKKIIITIVGDNKRRIDEPIKEDVILTYESFKMINEDDDFDSDIEQEIDNNIEESPADVKKSFTDFNETPEYYIDSAIRLIKSNVLKMFAMNNDKEVGQGITLTLLDERVTKMPNGHTFFLKFSDDTNIYSVSFNIPLNQSIADESGDEMTTKMVKYTGVKLKRYDLDSQLIGELDKQRVLVDKITSKFITSLIVELDTQLGGDDELKIEYED